MMTTMEVSYIMIIIATLLMMSTLSPMKMAVMMLTFSLVFFFLTMKMSGVAWFSLIYLLIFMGGILIMFMIVASISPNQKALKMNLDLMVVTVIIAIAAKETASCTWISSNPLQVMATFMSLNSSIAIIAMVMAYFLMFLKIISSESGAMRSVSCH